MKKGATMRALAFSVLSLSLVLAGCGSTCFGPFGDFQQCYGNVPTTATNGATSTSLSIVPETAYVSQPIPASTSITLTAANGSGSYVWTVLSSVGTAGTISNVDGTTASIYNSSSIRYTSPSASGTHATIIQLSDGITTTVLAFATKTP